MSKVCVVTGGGSGMGLEIAKKMASDHIIVLAGRTPSKLESAVDSIKAIGGDARICAGDVSDAESVKALVSAAQEIGEIDVVVNAAGIAPSMTDDAAKILNINAIGTVNIDEAFAEVMDDGCILNIASSSGYMLPADRIPVQVYALVDQGTAALAGGLGQVLMAVPEEKRGGMAYCISKNFVIWYTKKLAVKYGSKGLRVVSISPGIIKTPLSDSEASSEYLAKGCALGRMASAEEIAFFMEAMIRDTYITGVDVLYDGGLIAKMQQQ